MHVTDTPLGRTLVLDRPHRRNALTLPLWRRLGRLVREHGADTSSPLYVVGAGAYFCSGADLDTLTWARSSAARAQTFVEAVVGALLELHAAEREVVAVVEGGAAGGGVEIMLACDRRVGIGSPTLVFPFGQHGMPLDGLTRWRLERQVGAEAAALLLRGRQVVDTAQACRLGLLDEVRASLHDLPHAERSRVGEGLGLGPAYPGVVRGIRVDPEVVRSAAAPMLSGFPQPPAP